MGRLAILLAIMTSLSVGLAACAAPGGPTESSPPPTPPMAASDLARTDSQGAVEFVVTPLNLSTPGATLDFNVAMDTHSVDLGWDLAAQSELANDRGLAVSGLAWPVGSGHHYEAVLTFPAASADGRAVLDGALTLTLTIRGTDAAERVFTWTLPR